jgi:3-hydroxybutyryl-CoA dehydratase
VSQTLQFRKPVPVGDTVTARIEVSAIRPGGRAGQLATCATVVRRDSDNAIVIDGEAVVLLPKATESVDNSNESKMR